MFREVIGTSMLKKAQDVGAVEFSIINLRDYGIGSRKTLDDTPYVVVTAWYLDLNQFLQLLSMLKPKILKASYSANAKR